MTSNDNTKNGANVGKDEFVLSPRSSAALNSTSATALNAGNGKPAAPPVPKWTPEFQEGMKSIAELRRKLYLTYLEAGFSKDEALTLCTK